MRRFFVVVFSVLSVCTCISCSNLSLAKRNTSTGIVFIQILDAYTTSRKAAPVVQEQVDVEKYHIAVIKEEAEDLVFEKEYTPAELDAGVSLDLDAGVYKVCIKAYGSEGILFVGETVEPLTVTLENTPENPAVAEIDMKIVLAIFDNGLYAPVQQVYLSCLEGAMLPQFLSVDTTDFPNTWFVEGKVLNGWTDSVNNTNYSISADIDISDKKLPLHLTANWSEPVDPAGGGSLGEVTQFSTGTAISTADDFLNISMTLSGTYYLTQDITIENWTTGDLGTFTGKLYGNGHTITFPSCNHSIFHDLGNSGLIQDLIICGDFSSYPFRYEINGIVCLTNSGLIKNCHFTGKAVSDDSRFCIYGGINSGELSDHFEHCTKDTTSNINLFNGSDDPL